MATGAVGAAGVGTFVFVLLIGIPIVALVLGVVPMGPRPGAGGPGPVPIAAPEPVVAPADPAPVEPATVEPATVEPATVEPAPVEPAVAEPAPAAPDPAPPAPAASGLTFQSGMVDTKKMTVRCDQGSGQGEASVSLGDVSPRECTVVAIDGSRKRRTAVVKDVKPRTYRCFAGDADSCEPLTAGTGGR
jgi:hypothetical protein